MLQQFPARWVFWWVFLPNLAIIAMWPIGGPSMGFTMMVCGLGALLISQAPSVLVRRIGVAALFSFTLLSYIAASFNLSGLNIVGSLKYLDELHLLDSPEYMIAGIVLVASLLFAMRFAPHTARLSSRDERLLAFTAVALIVNVDAAATAETRGSYKVSAPAGAPIDSAIIQNDVSPGAVASRNLVVIMVEALGLPSNTYDRALFDEMWAASRWSSRYQVSTGKTTYFGSTTNAELREWCGVWADHYNFDFDSAECLPQDFREAGFHTVAMHSFTGEFFDRRQWYPKIGFEETLFAPELLRFQVERCGGVFPGACDTDIPRLIGDHLRKSQHDRNLVYWLTVNTHLPLPADKSLDTEQCDMGSPQWRENFPMLCRSYLLQRRLADAITAEIMRADFPEADILIVGDHMPPFFPRAIRSRYNPGSVPWIYLRDREGSAGARGELGQRSAT